MNIEQIAVGIKDLHGLDMSDEAAITLLRHVLSKLAEQEVEPVGYFYLDCLDGGMRQAMDKDFAHIHQPLYTETQLLAAQQRTAEACAKAVERLISGDGICADNEVWIHDCADAIRRGDWREYL